MKFTTKYKGMDYTFNDGCEAFIFDCAMCNEFDKEHDEHEVDELIYLVYRCWLKDCNNAAVDKLTDFMCDHFEKVKDMGCYEILDKFYNCNDNDNEIEEEE